MTKHFLSIASIVFFCLSVISCSDNNTDRKLILDFDQSTKRYGYVDSLGNVVIPYQYYSAEEFVDGYAKVKDLKHYGIINQSGKAVLPLAYTLIEDFQHGVAFASTWVDHENKYALINRKGELLTPAKYDRVRDFSEDLAVTVIDGMNPIHIFIDTLGNEVLKSDYPEVYPFHDGMARVGSSWNCIFGYIDKTGKEVIPLKYGDATDFSEGLAAVKQNSRWGYIDTKGNTVIPFEFCEAQCFSEGLAAVSKKRH